MKTKNVMKKNFDRYFIFPREDENFRYEQSQKTTRLG